MKPVKVVDRNPTAILALRRETILVLRRQELAGVLAGKPGSVIEGNDTVSGVCHP
jgi:hypothetical protein